MKFEKWHLGLIIVLLIVLVSSIVWYLKSSQDNSQVLGKQTNQVDQPEVSYFDENAKVMYFYSDSCGWCNKEKTVLTDLVKEGYSVKPMDVGVDPQLLEKYSIQGTPTFIADNGEQLVGYQEKDALKKWLDEHK